MDCKLVREFFGPQYQYNYWYFIYTFLLYAPHHIKQSTGSSKTSGGTQNEFWIFVIFIETQGKVTKEYFSRITE